MLDVKWVSRPCNKKKSSFLSFKSIWKTTSFLLDGSQSRERGVSWQAIPRVVLESEQCVTGHHSTQWPPFMCSGRPGATGGSGGGVVNGTPENVRHINPLGFSDRKSVV